MAGERAPGQLSALRGRGRAANTTLSEPCQLPLGVSATSSAASPPWFPATGRHTAPITGLPQTGLSLFVHSELDLDRRHSDSTGAALTGAYR